jgi:hypothetical protein
MMTFQELADEVFADVLKKHCWPVDPRAALRKSARTAERKGAKDRRAAKHWQRPLRWREEPPSVRLVTRPNAIPGHLRVPQWDLCVLG